MKIEKGSVVQSFGDLVNIVRRSSEAVHSPKRTVLKTGKKFSVLHKEKQRLTGTLWCDIMNDRFDCKALHQPVKLFSRHGFKISR